MSGAGSGAFLTPPRRSAASARSRVSSRSRSGSSGRRTRLRGAPAPFRAAGQSRARNQSFQGFAAGFPGAARLRRQRPIAQARPSGSSPRASPLPPRALARGIAGRGSLRARNQSFQGLAADFSGDRRQRPIARARRLGSSPAADPLPLRALDPGISERGGAAPPDFRAWNSVFSMACGRISGRSSPAEAPERPSPSGSAMLSKSMSSKSCGSYLA